MADWFRHDTDARNDIKIRKLLRDSTPGALGAYWICVEILFEAGGYEQRAILADELSFYNMDGFIDDLIAHGLLEDVGNGAITSHRVLSEVSYKEERRKQKSEAGKKGMESRWGRKGNSVITKDNSVITDDNRSYQSITDRNTIPNHTIPNHNNITSLSKDSLVGGQQADTPAKNEEGTDLFGEKVKVERDPVPVQKIVEYWNNAVKPTALPKVTEITKERRSLIRQRWKEYRDEVYVAIDRTATSDFLTGRDGRWQMCDFDWVFTKKNMVKIFEGKYNRKAPANNRYNNGKSFKPHDINGQYDDEELEVITEL